MVNKEQHVDDLKMINKGQEGHIGSRNADCEMSCIPKIRRRKLKEMRVTEHDAHVTFGLLKGLLELCYLDCVVFKLRSVPHQFSTLRGWINGEIKARASQEFVIGFGKGCVEDTLDKATITDEEEEVNQEECCSKNDEDDTKAKDETGLSKLKAAMDLIITNSGLLAEVITELKEFIPGAHTPLKRVRKVAVESTSDALIDDKTNKSNSRSSGSYESEGFLMENDEIEKHFVGPRDKVHDFPKFIPPSFTLRLSQEGKEALPKRVIIVDSVPNILATKVQVLNEAQTKAVRSIGFASFLMVDLKQIQEKLLNRHCVCDPRCAYKGDENRTNH
ncbi:hypothetical protein Cgig2_012695 [Carnegiea gigantea]|uniref:Uncharacterized protein n=1 Tax=Carnegiea gigantea TaxID=171969 RepID=A0A9Q1GMN2_9CARY|nr:hypothetical protein Cgig2_012695 [Carnegiea gigantea]